MGRFLHLAVSDACQSYSNQLHALHRQLQALTDWLPSQKEPPPPHSEAEHEAWKKSFPLENDDETVSDEDIELEDGFSDG